MDRAAYHATLKEFIGHSENEILGALVQQSHFPVTDLQRNAWLFQIRHLQALLPSWVVPGNTGSIHFEYAIPRMGRRIDVLLLLNGVLFVLEYKVGETHYSAHAYDQVMDYALDLKKLPRNQPSRRHCPHLDCDRCQACWRCGACRNQR